MHGAAGGAPEGNRNAQKRGTARPRRPEKKRVPALAFTDLTGINVSAQASGYMISANEKAL